MKIEVFKYYFSSYYIFLLTIYIVHLSITYICFMQFLKKTLKFYVFSNLHVALAGFCFAKITLLKFNNLENVSAVFIAFSIVVSYNFIRFYELKTNQLNLIKEWFVTHLKWLWLLTAFSGVGMLYILFFTDFNSSGLILLFPFLIMTIFYVIPLFKIKSVEVSFRNFPGIKIFSIGIAWSGVSVLFPLYEAGVEFTLNVYLEFIQRILILIVIVIPFDIRDVMSDSYSLKTLPQIIGVYGSKWLGSVLLIIFVLLAICTKNTINEFLVRIFIAVVAALLLWFSSSERPRFYTSLLVESVPIFWLVLILLFS